MLANIKLIIFDLDGTLVNAYPAINKSFNFTLNRLGYPRQSARVIRRAVGWGDENLLRPFIKEKDLARALSLYRRHHRRALLSSSFTFPHTRQVLAYFNKRGYRMAIASNRPTRFTRILLRHLDLKKYFGYILCADKLKYGKPHPQILRRIMQKFSFHPAQTAYVGDMIIDAQAGRRAGVKTIIVTTGSSSRKEIKKERPYRVIANIGGLLTLFQT
ncbi:MAG: HAD family hydrolase [Candidatus Omnitrophota bacterium]